MPTDTLTLDLEKRFAGFGLALSRDLPLEGITAIFGPSGSGKSTLLRLIAGFERPDRGRILGRDEVWCDTAARRFLPPYKRPAGFVRQGAPLLPHLSVAGNLSYGEKRTGKRPARYSLEDVTAALDIAPLMEHRPAMLSGGERQRVALAQALLTRPDILLLDEPFSALDRKRKLAILPYLQRLQAQFAMPVLYVSHDIEEVASLADRILILEAGRETAYGDVTACLNAHAFGEDDDGAILSGQVTAFDERLDLMDIEVAGGVLRLPAEQSRSIGDPVRLLLRANEVALSLTRPDGLSIRNALTGEVAAIRADGDGPFMRVEVTLSGTHLPVRVTRAAAEDLSLQEGQAVYALIKTATLAG
ncbi:molybdenum ABC transporter ATP-binding protein [Henriciella aquimarina]|uniref:molybdenum ABC transporter ATP-binding protein n=1 Tax=Henriciella aquimarina TaxID=545261 RepID=UPI001302054F|nr:molybdenum ABC transporter ATP-binding protein [Henriciella aquimarina]